MDAHSYLRVSTLPYYLADSVVVPYVSFILEYKIYRLDEDLVDGVHHSLFIVIIGQGFEPK